MTNPTSPVTAGLIPPAPSRWKIRNLDTLLRAQDYTTLDELLDDALAASFESREAEGRYYDTLPGDLADCLAAGVEGLARLRAWQAARPQSAHAWVSEGYYWLHWAFVYRGSGWANSVSELQWTCAHACAERTAVAALHALALAPTMWNAAALLLRNGAAFNDPEWLSNLVRDKRLSPGEPRDNLRLAERTSADRDELLQMFARSGLRFDQRIVLPTTLPEALPSALVGKKFLRDKHYWMHATMHIHPRLFYFLRECVQFMQPRWSGSHAQIRAFVASPACAHLDDLEKDRLLHEIWRDDYLLNSPDEDSEEADVRRWMIETRKRAAVALLPYHRYETMRWMAACHYNRKEMAPALACLQEAEQHHFIDDSDDMEMALHLALSQGQEQWLGQAVIRSANGYGCTAALVLHGYFSLKGVCGFVPNDAVGKSWLEAARLHLPGSGVWSSLSALFSSLQRPADAFEMATLGLAAGGGACDLILGQLYERGIHVAKDPQAAVHYYRMCMEDGGNMGAFYLGSACFDLYLEAKTPSAERERYLLDAIEAMHRAHKLEHTEGLTWMLRYTAELNDIPARHHFVNFVREHAEAGNPYAMASLSSLLSSSVDKALYDYRESVRWIMGAQAAAPDLEFVQSVIRVRHEDGFLSKMLYKLERKKIKAHEIPGNDNVMI